MTIQFESNRKVYSCNGVLTDFSFDFFIFEDTDLKVTITDSNGNATVLEITTDYTVAGENGKFESGGTVTTVKEVDGAMEDYAWPNGSKITIELDLEIKQETDLVYGGTYSTQSIERMADRLTKICQQLNDAINRSVVLSTASTLSGLTIPDLIADRFLYAADAETLGWAVSVDTTVLTVSDWARTLLDDVNAAAALGTLGVTAFIKTLIDNADSPAALKTLLSLLHTSIAKTATYTVTTADRGKLINFDCASGNLVAELPAAATAGNGFTIAIKKTDSSGNYLEIDPNGAELIEGGASHIIRLQNSVVMCVCDGTGWKTVSNNEITGAMCATALKDPVSGTAGLRTLGTGAQQAAPGNLFTTTAGPYPAASMFHTYNTTSTTYVKIGSDMRVRDGAIRTRLGLRRWGTAGSVYGRIYKNGSAIGTQRSTTASAMVYFEQDFNVNNGDRLQLYVHTSSGSDNVYGELDLLTGSPIL